jgi:CxxC motif-containing protein (DUF1111 family)
MSASLAFDLQQPGWAARFKSVRDQHSGAFAVNIAMQKLGTMALYGERTRTSELDLVDMLVGVYARAASHAPSKAERERMAQ